MEQNNEQIKLNDLDELIEFTGIMDLMKQYNPTRGHFKADAYFLALLQCRLLNCHVSSVDILDDSPSKSSVFNHLNSASFNVSDPCLLSTLKLVQTYLTIYPRCTLSFIIDDTIIRRPASIKHVEGVSRVFDHNAHSCVPGYFCVTLALNVGELNVVLGNYLVSSKGNENVPTSNENVPITCNFKNWSEDIHLHLNCTKVQAAIDLIKHIAPTVEHYLDRRVDNLLVDSWYADNQNFVMEVNSLGYKTIGLIRLSDTKYVTRKGDTVTTKSLANELKADESAQSTNDIVATYQLRRSNPTAAQKNKAKSLGQTNFVQSFKGNFVNVSFCKNKTPSSSRPLLPLMDTNLERKPETSKSIYGKRWAIESIYKVVKDTSLGDCIYKYYGRSLNGEFNNINISYFIYNLMSFKACMSNVPTSVNREIAEASRQLHAMYCSEEHNLKISPAAFRATFAKNQLVEIGNLIATICGLLQYTFHINSHRTRDNCLLSA